MTAEKGQPNASTSAAGVVSPPMYISTPTLCSLLTHKALIDHLKTTLPTHSSGIQSPLRQAYQTSAAAASLLLMPSWSTIPSLPYIGVKLVTFHPNNFALNLPGIHASYVLFHSVTGQTLATLDATELTLYRTSCISALASQYLSRKDSETLVMIGAGALAPHLIRGHLTVRPTVRRVIVWNRRAEKSHNLVLLLREEDEFQGVSFEEAIGSLEEVVREGDIVSCATSSDTPLVKGQDLKLGAHLDLVGSFTHSMRECDDEAIRRGRVFIDNEAAWVESGELVGAFGRGVITRGDIAGDLVELITGEKTAGRMSSEEITVFKSVGSAAVDLLSAQLLYETCLNKPQSQTIHG